MSALDRAWVWIREQLAFLAVLVVLLGAFGYLLVAPGRWGRATGGIAGAVVLAGLLRLALPGARIGLLAVRGRIFDAACYLSLGALLLVVQIRLHG